LTNLLVKLFVKDSENINEPKVRGSYGVLSGSVGIAVNVILCLAKFFVGTVTNSIAITADAANNLSDAGSSAVTLFGFKMSSRPADAQHPFGHGRIEYLTAMVVSFIILFMGVELGIQSVQKIINPQDVVFNLTGAIIIGISILGKVWLAVFNHKLGKKIDSPAMSAVVVDSLSDIAATSTTLIALILSYFFPSLHIDGFLGILVACFVLRGGIDILKNTFGALIGEPPTKEMVDDLENKILSYDHVSGIHDLMLHNYGPDRFFGSVHVEIPSDIDVMVGHDIIDNIEREVSAETGIQLIIHYDPVVVNNEKINALKEFAKSVVKSVGEELSLHDFRVVEGPSHTNLIFDVVTPYKFGKTKDEIISEVSEKISAKDSRYFAVINVEHSFV
jgi:cation diffusion facilitator family transporter